MLAIMVNCIGANQYLYQSWITSDTFSISLFSQDSIFLVKWSSSWNFIDNLGSLHCRQWPMWCSWWSVVTHPGVVMVMVLEHGASANRTCHPGQLHSLLHNTTAKNTSRGYGTQHTVSRSEGTNDLSSMSHIIMRVWMNSDKQSVEVSSIQF